MASSTHHHLPTSRDGVQLSVADCVYIDAGPGKLPYIAKILRLADGWAKVRWFFRPQDIPQVVSSLNEPAESKEVFLATGDGPAAVDNFVYDTILGKCQLLCTARHELNLITPSDEDMLNAEFTFSRCFDVQSSTISPDLSKAIEEVGARNLFNRSSVNMVGQMEQSGSSFSDVTWKEKLEQCYESGLVIELENFDPAITTAGIQKAFQLAFPGVQCDIRVTPLSLLPVRLDYMRKGFSLISGHALVCFSSRTDGENVLRDLQEGCLVFTSDERSVIAQVAEPPKVTKFPGHMDLEMFNGPTKTASWHFAKMDTLEFAMAVQWRVLEERHKLQWKLLHESQEQELQELLSKEDE